MVQQGYVYKSGILPEEGYSSQVIADRLEILKGARDFLMDDEERTLYLEDLEKAREAGEEQSAMILEIPLEKVGIPLFFPKLTPNLIYSLSPLCPN